MQIVRCDPTFDARWNAYVSQCPTASFYHRAEWRDINARCFGHRSCHLAALDGDRIVGIFPIVQLKSVLFGNVACSMPFVNYGGPCSDTAEIEQALIDAAWSLVQEWRLDYLEIRSRHQLPERYPSAEHKVSMTVDLQADPDALWNAFKTGQRQEIRRGYKNGFEARFGGVELLADFYNVLSESWRDLGTPIFARAYLEDIVRTFPEETRVVMVYDSQGNPAAGAFDGLQGDTVEGMWMGTRAQYRKQLVGYVLYWELIKNACERGYAHFHLGRSSADSGGEQFKRKWNANTTQLYWHYLLRTRTEIPQLNVANAKYRTAIATWRKLPIGVAEFLGPRIARSIP